MPPRARTHTHTHTHTHTPPQVGKHNFLQFSTNATIGVWRDPVKTLKRVDVVDLGAGVLRVEVGR